MPSSASVDALVQAYLKDQPIMANIQILGARIINSKNAPIFTSGIMLHGCDIHIKEETGGLQIYESGNQILSTIIRGATALQIMNEVEPSSLWEVL